MTDFLAKDIKLHAIRDAESGVLRLVAEVEGKLIPVAAEKLGQYDARLTTETAPKRSGSK